MPAGPESDILDSLRRISRALDVFSHSLAARFRITTPQLVCLRALLDAPAQTPGQLAKEVLLSQATVTGILDRLEARGFIERRRDAQDRRRVLLYVTPAGRKAAALAPTPLHQRLAANLAHLPSDERQRIAHVLRRVAAMMEEAAPPPA
ncbi:MAG: MarR family winged helix-turn-helix transcriptional regulator [Desulfarculus sp.]|nr:MarR family winged helix-turn-helix transcriptional regulator [Desulfarculus sp.]